MCEAPAAAASAARTRRNWSDVELELNALRLAFQAQPRSDRGVSPNLLDIKERIAREKHLAEIGPGRKFRLGLAIVLLPL